MLQTLQLLVNMVDLVIGITCLKIAERKRLRGNVARKVILRAQLRYVAGKKLGMLVLMEKLCELYQRLMGMWMEMNGDVNCY